MKLGPAVVMFVLSLLLAPVAQAEDTTAAEVLFRDGRRLFDAGEHEVACRRFEASLRKDRAVGTLWHLARCYEKIGKNASAWERYQEVAALAKKLGRDKQKNAARRRAVALEPTLCRLKLDVASDADFDEVRVGERVFDRDVFGVAVPMDCGSYALVLRGRRKAAPDSVDVDKPGGVVELVVSVRAPMRAAAPDKPTDTARPSSVIAAEPWYHDFGGWLSLSIGVGLAGASGWALAGAASLERQGETDVKRVDRYRFAGYGLAATGAGATVVGIVKLIVHDSPAEAATSALWLSPTASGFGLAIGGRF